MPVYELLGGKCRRGAMIYSHASGREISETLDQARKIMAQGIKVVRLAGGCAGHGRVWRGTSRLRLKLQTSEPHDDVFEPEPYVRRTLELFEAGAERTRTGDRVTA